jgi:N-acetylneuraminic acid mutarotase
MWTYTHRAALCSLGFTMLACGDPATQPNTSPESVQPTPLLSTTVTGIWRRMPSIVPARGWMAAAVLDKSIVVVGGYNDAGALRRVDAYNLETKTWTQLQPLPESRWVHGATTVSGNIYVAGGYTSRLIDGVETQVPTKALFMFDASSRRWVRKADLPTEAGVVQQAGLLGRLYVCCVGNRFLAYTPKTDKWVSLRLPPSGHNSGVMAAVNGKLYYTSGYKEEFALNSELDVYDPATRTWTVKSSMLKPLTEQVAGTLHGKLWVAGGSSPDFPYRATADLQVYDPITDRWSLGPSMLSPSKGGTAAVAGGKLFVIGGQDYNGQFTGMVQALSTSY